MKKRRSSLRRIVWIKGKKDSLRKCDVPGPGRGSSFEEIVLVETRVEGD